VQQHLAIIIILAALMGKNATDDITTTYKHERQWSVNHLWQCIIENLENLAASLTHNRTIASLSGQNMVVTISGLCPNHGR
jgi:hypothetical protein